MSDSATTTSQHTFGDQTGVPGPYVIGATGGSGTRVTARIVRAAGVYIGTELNPYEDAVAFSVPGASFAELDLRVREGISALGYDGQPSHPICHGVGARAHEPPYAHQAGGGEIAAGMVLAIEPGCYIEGGGGLRVEDNFLITAEGSEKLSPFPDGIVRA